MLTPPRESKTICEAPKVAKNKSHFQDHLDERMTPHLSIQDDIPMCQECGRDSSKHPRWSPAKQMNDDYNSISLAPKTSNKSKNTTLSGPQIVGNIALNNVGFNEERTNRRNTPSTLTDLVRLNSVKKTTFAQRDSKEE